MTGRRPEKKIEVCRRSPNPRLRLPPKIPGHRKFCPPKIPQDLKNSGAPLRLPPPARGAPVLLRYKRYPNLRRVMRKPRRPGDAEQVWGWVEEDLRARMAAPLSSILGIAKVVAREDQKRKGRPCE